MSVEEPRRRVLCWTLWMRCSVVSWFFLQLFFLSVGKLTDEPCLCSLNEEEEEEEWCNNHFLSIFCRGSGLTLALKDTYSFPIYLDLFLCDDKLNKNCGFEIIYLGIFSSFEMSIYLFFYQTKKFSTKKLKFDK